MKRISSLFVTLTLIAFTFWACQKEYSIETGGNPDTGAISGFGWEMVGGGTSFSGCVDTAYYETIATYRGIYISLFDNAGNTVDLGLTAASGNAALGTYTLTQGAVIQVTTATGDTYQPAATGTSTSITITTSNDTLIAGTFSGTLKLNGTGADYLITNGKFKAKVGLPNPCGGTTPTPTTAYTIPSCAAITVQGTYTQGAAVTAANTVTIPVNVTTTGTWSVTTTAVGGLTFSGSGTFTTTGNQNIILTAAGTPTTSGANSIAVTAGSTNCSFSVTVIAATPAAYTLTSAATTCSNATVAGTYTINTATTAANTVTLDVNVTTAGFWNVTTTVVSGLSFSGAGTFTTTGAQTITLNASGTPTASGTLNIPVTAGSSNCNFDVTVATAPPVGAGVLTCKIDGVFTTFNVDASAISQSTMGTNVLNLSGAASASSTEPYLDLTITKNGSAITAGSYNVNQLLSGTILFATYTDASATDYAAVSGATSQTPAFTITITSITATKVVGTFSGPLKDASGQGAVLKTITEGVFDLPIQ